MQGEARWATKFQVEGTCEVAIAGAEPSIRMWVTIAFICTAGVFVGLTLATLHHQRWARRLPALEALAAPADGVHTSVVRCSVIVAARDEEARLDATVRHLLAQLHVAVEVIVVDDRSTDATGDILRRLTAEDARVRGLASTTCRMAGSASATRVMWAPASPRATGCCSPMPTAG